MKMKKFSGKKLIIFGLLLLSILSFEFLFCNSIFIRSIIFNNKFEFSPYVFSLPRLILYIISFVIAFVSLDRIIENSIRDKKQSKIINIFFILVYIAFAFLIFILHRDNMLSIMTIGVLIIVLNYFIFLNIFIGKNFKINILLISLITIIYSISCETVHLIDEVSHIPTTYNVAHLNFSSSKLYYDESLMKIRILSNYNENQDLFVHYQPKKIDITGHEVYRYDRTGMFTHFPSVIAIILSEKLHGTIMDTFYLGRIFGALFFIFLTYIFLKVANYKKYTLIAILMIPMLLMLSGTYNTDGYGYITIAIFISYIFELYKNDKIKQLTNKNVLIILLLFLMISLFKGASYSFVGLLLLLLRKKMKPKKKLLMIFGIVAILLFIVANVYLFMDLNSADLRGGDTSVIRQLKFALSNPYNLFLIPTLQIFNTLFNPEFFEQMNLAYFFGTHSNIIIIPYILFTVYMSLKDEISSKKEIILYIIIFILLLGYSSAAMYLTFTPVGEYVVKGYQGRYFFQLIPLLLFCFANKNILINKTKNSDLFIALFIITINITSLFLMIIK